MEDIQQTTTTHEEGKTFTQDEVNRIVSERLKKEKGKIDADREAAYTKKEQELNLREVKVKALETLNDKGLPKELIDVLNYSDEESMINAINILEKYINKNTVGQITEPRIVQNYSPRGGNDCEVDSIRDAFRPK